MSKFWPDRSRPETCLRHPVSMDLWIPTPCGPRFAEARFRPNADAAKAVTSHAIGPITAQSRYPTSPFLANSTEAERARRFRRVSIYFSQPVAQLGFVGKKSESARRSPSAAGLGVVSFRRRQRRRNRPAQARPPIRRIDLEGAPATGSTSQGSCSKLPLKLWTSTPSFCSAAFNSVSRAIANGS